MPQRHRDTETFDAGGLQSRPRVSVRTTRNERRESSGDVVGFTSFARMTAASRRRVERDGSVAPWLCGGFLSSAVPKFVTIGRE